MSDIPVTYSLPFAGGSVTGNDVEGAILARSMAETDARYKRQSDAWVMWLLALGVKAAHPDDGWVDRKKNEVHLCYPYFDRGPDVGDLICLGHGYGSRPQFRFVRVIGLRRLVARLSIDKRDFIYYEFEEASR